MCSYRTCVPMIACLLIPGFELRAALRARPRLALVPAALAPEAGEEPLLGPVTAAAEAAGVKPGMRLGEALATCPSLVLVDRDPAAVEREWEGCSCGASRTRASPSTRSSRALSSSRRGGSSGSTEECSRRSSARSPRSAPPGTRASAPPDVASPRSRAASVARAGQILIVAAKEEQAFLEPLPLSLLP